MKKRGGQEDEEKEGRINKDVRRTENEVEEENVGTGRTRKD